jgi:glycosyltransferase involved in cell wall biosynthesis
MNMFRVPAQEGRPLDQRRVLMTVDAVGGVWRYAMELARGLLNHKIDVVFAGLGPQPTSHQADEAKRLGKLVWLDEPLDWIAPDEAAVKHLPAKLAHLAREERADVLHLNLPSQAAGIETDLPLVVVSHSCVVTWWHTMRGEKLPQEWQWMKGQNARGMARADVVVAPSGSHAQAIGECYGQQPKLTVIHNSISAFLHGGEKQPLVFAAGRWWDEGKNGRVLDEAAARTLWPVVMAGSTKGPNGQEISLLNARRAGEIPHRQVLSEVKRAGIVASPSLYEPFGLAALEGARAGAALVLSDIPTYRELWGGAAIFFDPHDAGALAHAVNRLASDSGLRNELAARALARSRRFTPDIQAGRMAELYRELVDRPMAA